MNNIKAIINYMKLTELCRQNKIAPAAIPFGLHLHLSVYFFLKSMYQNRWGKKPNVQFAGENETPYLSLKTTSLCFLKHCAIFKKRRKKNVHQNSYTFHSLFLHKYNLFLDQMELDLTILQIIADSILFFYNYIYFIMRAKGGKLITLICYIILI